MLLKMKAAIYIPLQLIFFPLVVYYCYCLHFTKYPSASFGIATKYSITWIYHNVC